MGGTRRVLIVEPDDALITASQLVAGELGLSIDIAPSQAMARTMFAATEYGVVAIDPGRGRALVEDLCAHRPTTTMIALTGAAGLEGQRSARIDAAIATILPTPGDAPSLTRALHDAFELHERRTRQPPRRVAPMSVLLVEDNDGDAFLVCEHLAEIAGAFVQRATRVATAINLIRADRFDFIISDLTLPDARGLDAVRQLLPLAPDTPLIVLTGLDDEELALQAVHHGAQDYLVKAELEVSTLRRTLRHARERKQEANRLVYQARHDPLTGVGNRAALRARIDDALAQAARRPTCFAVMYIDLDRFKTINDTCGHDAGDAVLCEVAARMRDAVRAGDLVSRLGGDEFVVFLADVCGPSRPVEVAERILRSLERPIIVGEHTLGVTGSIGVAVYPETRGSADDLLKAADAAMYTAKTLGRNNVQLVGAVDPIVGARLALAAELQHALERGELALHFQPQYSIAGNRLVAYEALLRWQRRQGTLVLPGDFVPLLEENGRIVAVGEWVIDQACAQLAAWRAAGQQDIRVAVNLSARQLERPGLVAHVRAAIDRHRVPARALEVEITESTLMGDTQTARRILGQLRDEGVRVAIDDFGTGYSSLAYLTRFAVDVLKIDRSFIDGVDRDRERSTITSAIVSLGHHLGLEVVAEGVETVEQLAFLSQVNCDIAQGFLLGRPGAAESLGAPRDGRFAVA